MPFRIDKKGVDRISPPELPPQFREAFLYSYTKPPDALRSNWILTSVGIANDGENGKHFEYVLSGALFKEDADILQEFGDQDGNDVVITLSYRDVPQFEDDEPNNMKHSPAPWRIGNKQERAILDANGSQIAVLPESLKADAALIAAAPEMYEVMKGLEALGSDIAPYWAERIKSAIAKAEGK